MQTEQVEKLMNVLEEVYFQKNRLGLEHFLQGEMRVLTFIYQEKRVILPGEIASALDMTGGRVAGILRSLEKKDYIIRKTDETDRRRVLVSITESGAKCVSDGARTLKNALTELIEILGADETDTFIKSMEKYIAAAEQVKGKYRERG